MEHSAENDSPFDLAIFSQFYVILDQLKKDFPITHHIYGVYTRGIPWQR